LADWRAREGGGEGSGLLGSEKSSTAGSTAAAAEKDWHRAVLASKVCLGMEEAPARAASTWPLHLDTRNLFIGGGRGEEEKIKRRWREVNWFLTLLAESTERI
jgi:hypothetical protein